MLQAGDLVVGEPVTLEIIGTGKRYRLSVKYLDRQYVYLSLPEDEDKTPVSPEPGADVKLIVTGFGKMFVYTTKVQYVEDTVNGRLVVQRTGPPEEAINRANLRLSVQIKTKMQIIAEDGSVKVAKDAELMDISAGGGRLRTSENLTRDAVLSLSFPLHGSEPVETPAKVVRVFPAVRRGVNEMALQFTGDRAEALGDRIVKWIMDQQRRRAGR
ncbi:MAG: PilZ domain-containing protein [Chloroflexi bacterium]|nr:PilZ domain-containing protein [Chloroflexota bacterium]